MALATESTKVTLQRQVQGVAAGSGDNNIYSVELEFVPNVTTVQDLLRSARIHFQVKNLSLSCPGNIQAALQHVYSYPSEMTKEIDEGDAPKALVEDEDDVHQNKKQPGSNSIMKIGDVFQDGDTAAFVPVSKESAKPEAYCIYKVNYHVHNGVSLGDLLSYKLNMYHTIAGIDLIEKPHIRTIHVQVKDKRIEFLVGHPLPAPPSRDNEGSLVKEESSVILLASDSLKHLYEKICTAFGISATAASRHRLSLYSPKDDQHWFQGDRSNAGTLTTLHELGLSGPVLEGYFDELSLVLVKTTIAGKTLALRTRLSDTVSMVKTKLHHIIGIPCEQQELTFHNQYMEDHHSLVQHGVTKRSVLRLGLRLPKVNKIETVEEEQKSSLTLTLIVSNNHLETVQVEASSAVSELQEYVHGIGKDILHDLVVPCASIGETSTSSSIENKCHSLAKNFGDLKLPSKGSIDRANQTINNAFDSIQSADQLIGNADQNKGDRVFGEI